MTIQKSYSQEEIDRLISCPKEITKPPHKEMRSDRGHLRNDMDLREIDGKADFSVYIRINETFRENFSIGLDYYPGDEPGAVPLIRCNGQHSEHNPDPLHGGTAHYDFHVHRVTAAAIDDGASPLKEAHRTEKYASFEEALRYFIRITGIKDADRHFPQLRQPSLFPEVEP